MKHFVIFINTLLLLVLSHTAFAQNSPGDLTEKEKQGVITSIADLLKENYVFPEKGKKMGELLKKHREKGKYRSLRSPEKFAQVLTEDVRSVSKDLHLRVIFDPEGIAERKKAVTEEEKKELKNNFIERAGKHNFGFKEIKILDGNIGYLDLRGFHNPEYAGKTAVAAMNFLSNSDALIIDLRNNGGGSPEMIQLLSSFLWDGDPKHLNDFYYRPDDAYHQSWTLPYVPGKRMPETNVYILISKKTFSAAEEFSYNLKHMDRAILIGETTGGGAHPGGTVVASERFKVWVPNGRSINPVTKTNWEGVGVIPDIRTTDEEALLTARIKAIEDLQAKNENDHYRSILKTLKAQKQP